MPVQVLICVHAFLKNTPLFYLSSCDMLLTVWDNGEILVDDFSNITTCSHFTYETVSDLKDLGLVIQHQLLFHMYKSSLADFTHSHHCPLLVLV